MVERHAKKHCVHVCGNNLPRAFRSRRLAEERALCCYMNRDREARLIDGDVFVFENDPEMTPVTEEQMNYVIVNGMDDGRLTTYDFSYMLEPFHGEERRKQYSNSASRAYKLESSGDEQRYAVFYRDQNDIVQYILIFTEGEYDSKNRNYLYSVNDQTLTI